MIAAAKIAYLQERIARYDDQSAYKELFVLLYNPLLQFAASFVKAKEPAEEIVSDVFMAIWERRKRIDSISNLKVYLYVATKNTAINYLARQNKLVTTNIAEMELEPESIYFNPEQLLITAEMGRRIREAVSQLPPKCQIIFRLVKEDELKYREVAEILNLSVKTVENQLSIALRKIGAAIHFDISKTISSM
ncbi:MAG TPA: RNA polymerase sigma-70 factor [Chitinophagaceae bacterium]|nr:RNA polymerase sigma-70 factor [Chitinophagaceae bacterium]